VLDRQPSDLQARFLLGLEYRKLGRTNDAISEWRCCLAVDPKNEQVMVVLASTEGGLRQVNEEPRDGRAER
jgi:cytochrome c-type biogenesis protein CcmH/NrfG